MTANNNTCEQLLDSSDAARILKINTKTLQSMARSGKVPAIRIGKLWRFHKAQLESWLRSQSRRKL
jgi:excisionase family DNA binding protein